MDPYLTTEEVAARYGVTTREVLYAVRTGKLSGMKAGWVWLFSKQELPKDWPVRKKQKRVV